MKVIEMIIKFWYKVTFKFRRQKININRAQLTGNENFIDIRYTLSRPDKAQKKFETFLTDHKTRKQFNLMKLPRYGLVKTKHEKYNHNGILIFRNYENIITRGSKVNLTFGKLKVENIEIS